MQRLDSEVTRRFYEGNASNTTSHVHLPIDKSVASMNYHLDYSSISKQDVTHTSILPPKYLADQLLQIYMEKVNGSLPFIRQDLFLAQYSCCYSIDGTSPGRKWLAVFNMVLAIACTLGRLSGLNLPREVDENVFSERARSLSLSDNVLYDHGDLQQVQAEALMAFFFLTQSQINRYGMTIISRVNPPSNLMLTITNQVMENDRYRSTHGYCAGTQYQGND